MEGRGSGGGRVGGGTGRLIPEGVARPWHLQRLHRQRLASAKACISPIVTNCRSPARLPVCEPSRRPNDSEPARSPEIPEYPPTRLPHRPPAGARMPHKKSPAPRTNCRSPPQAALRTLACLQKATTTRSLARPRRLVCQARRLPGVAPSMPPHYRPACRPQHINPGMPHHCPAPPQVRNHKAALSPTRLPVSHAPAC